MLGVGQTEARAETGDVGQIQKATGRVLYSVGGWDEGVV